VSNHGAFWKTIFFSSSYAAWSVFNYWFLAGSKSAYYQSWKKNYVHTTLNDCMIGIVIV